MAVWNRTVSKMQPLVEQGAKQAVSAKEATSGCIFETVQFHTAKSKPAFNMYWAMLRAMLPDQMNATFMMVPVATDHATFYCAMRHNIAKAHLTGGLFAVRVIALVSAFGPKQTS